MTYPYTDVMSPGAWLLLTDVSMEISYHQHSKYQASASFQNSNLPYAMARVAMGRPVRPLSGLVLLVGLWAASGAVGFFDFFGKPPEEEVAEKGKVATATWRAAVRHGRSTE